MDNMTGFVCFTGILASALLIDKCIEKGGRVQFSVNKMEGVKMTLDQLTPPATANNRVILESANPAIC